MDGEGGRSNLRYILIGMGAFLLFGVLALAMTLGGGDSITSWTKSEMTPEKVEAELMRRPEFSATFREIRTFYPNEYRDMLSRVATAINREGDEAAGREAFQFQRQFMTARFPGLSRAPASELHRIAQEYAGLARALQSSDVALCAQWLSTGFAPGMRPSVDVGTRINRIGAMQVRAAHAGESNPAAPMRTLSPEDSNAFAEAIETRDAAAAALIDDQVAFNAAPRERQCSAGVVIYEAVASLPPESAANVTIELLRASFGAGQGTSGK